MSKEVRELLQQGREHALTAVAETDPRLTAGHLAQLETAIDRSRPAERHAFRRLVVATRKGGDHAD